jgi:Protein of unknown function (DUF3224)
VENLSIDTAFEVLSWVPEVYDESIEGIQLSRVTVTKRFEGELNGDSVGHGLVTAVGEAPGAYVVVERVTGKAHEREGTFVIQHGGVVNKGKVQHQWGDIVPDTGTGGFKGVTGRALFTHDENGAFIRFDMEFED